MNKALTIAGSDSSGGAGIQADIKTMTSLNVYGMTAITGITAQNTLCVDKVFLMEKEAVSMQLDSIFSDIRPCAVKTGMLGNTEIILAVSEKLKEYKARNIVVDPVMVATSGSALLEEDSINALIENLLPLADIITPNIPEAEKLSGITINNHANMINAAKKISKYLKGAVLIKGGHWENSSEDLLYSDNSPTWLKEEKLPLGKIHGTGCILSAAIASFLAKGNSVTESAALGKKFLYNSLKGKLINGKGAAVISEFNRVPRRQAPLL